MSRSIEEQLARAIEHSTEMESRYWAAVEYISQLEKENLRLHKAVFMANDKWSNAVIKNQLDRKAAAGQLAQMRDTIAKLTEKLELLKGTNVSNNSQ